MLEWNLSRANKGVENCMLEVLLSSALLCCFRCWQCCKCCICGTNSSIRLPCWIFSGQHDAAACELDRHGFTTLMRRCLNRQLAIESHTYTHALCCAVLDLRTVFTAKHTDSWILQFYNLLMNLLNVVYTGHYYVRWTRLAILFMYITLHCIYIYIYIYICYIVDVSTVTQCLNFFPSVCIILYSYWSRRSWKKKKRGTKSLLFTVLVRVMQWCRPCWVGDKTHCGAYLAWNQTSLNTWGWYFSLIMVYTMNEHIQVSSKF